MADVDLRDGKSGSYLLPVKVAVRKGEGLQEGATVALHLVVGA